MNKKEKSVKIAVNHLGEKALVSFVHFLMEYYTSDLTVTT